MSTQKVSDTLINSMAASKLTGALPAVDGTALTGVSGFPDTTSASDPATNTNPSAVGATWLNTTNSEIFVCTDKTTDANVWTNVGSGSGDVIPYNWGGTSYGYVYGGEPTSGARVGMVSTFSLTTDGDSTQPAGLTQSVTRSNYTGNSSLTHGYCMGGSTGTASDVIDRFAFANEGGGMSDVGNLSSAKEYLTSAGNEYHAWITIATAINKLNYVSGGSANLQSANLVSSANSYASSSSSTHGYSMGGWAGGPHSNSIEKYVFATDTDSEDVGDMSMAPAMNNGLSSSTHGYSCGGYPDGPGGGADYAFNGQDKFSFSSDAITLNIGTLSDGKFSCGAVSSTTYGYLAGGHPASSANGTVSKIQKIDFASDGNATSVGDLTRSPLTDKMGQGSQV